MSAEECESLIETWIENEVADLSEAPSWESRAAAGNLMKKISKDFKANSASPSMELVQDVAAASLMLAEDSKTKLYALKIFGTTLSKLEELITEKPELSSELLVIAASLVSASHVIITGNTLSRHKNFSSRINPLAEANAKASFKRERACEIAAELWSADTGEEFRLSEMAIQIKDILQREGHEGLPGLDRIKDWIRPVAPEHARRPGRGKSPRA